MSWKQLIDAHWTDVFGAGLLALSVACYLLVNPEFGMLIAGAGLGVIRGDRKNRKADEGQGGTG